MAVPSIISVTPSTIIATTREQVVIAGSNFNLWPDIPFPNAGVAVFFVFNGDEFLADHIGVIDDTEIRCQAVMYMGDHKADPMQADIKVVNLDASGDPVVGEVDTLANAFTYIKDDHLPGDTGQWDLAVRVFREYLRLLNVTLHANIGIATHTDYHPEGTIVHFEVDFPAIGITDVSAELIPQTRYDPDADREEGQEEEYLPTQYVWLRFTLIPMADNPMEAISLTGALLRFGQRVGQIQVPKGPGSSDRLVLKHSLDPMPAFVFNAAVGTSQSSFSVRLGPVPVESPEVIDRVYPLEEALVHAWASVGLTGPKRDTTILTP